jgi:hypothetical protein
LNRRLACAHALIFLAIFGVYLHALNPAFRADDSPETAASCVILGIQHPPAYPLFTLVGRLATFIPLATPAWRINLLAALFGSLTCLVVMAILTLWSGQALAGALGAILLGLSPTFWSQSLAAKGGIYTFHASLLAMLVLTMTLWDRDIRARMQRAQSSRLRLLQSRYFLASVWLFFLGFGNHWETQSLFLPAIALWTYLLLGGVAIDPSLPSGKGLAAPIIKAALLVLAAGSVYLYLPLRAQWHPALNWGVPISWKQFWWVLLRQEYLDLEVGFLKALKSALLGGGDWKSVADNWITVKRQALRVATHLVVPGDLGIAGTLLAALGAFQLWSQGKKKELALSLGVIAVFCFVVTFYFQLKPEMLWILDVFLIPSYLMQALLAGMGTAWLIQKLPPNWTRLAALQGAMAAALLLGLWEAREPEISQHDHFWAWDYGRNFLDSLKPNAIVFAEGDFNTMPIYYLQQVQGLRRDVTHITSIFASTDWGVTELERTQPSLGLSIAPKPSENSRVGDGALLKSVISEIIAKNRPSRPIQASWFRQVEADNLPELEPFMSPSGLCAEYMAPETPQQWRRRINLPKTLVMRYLPLEKTRNDPSPAFALSNYGTLYMELANYLRNHGRVQDAMPLYATAVQVTTLPNLAEAWTHWGIALASTGKPEQAVEKFQRALQVKPIFEAYANLAGVMNQLKRYDEAEKYAREALAMLPASGASWNNLAISLYYRGRTQEAIQAAEEAAHDSPSDQTILRNLNALKGKS